MVFQSEMIKCKNCLSEKNNTERSASGLNEMNAYGKDQLDRSADIVVYPLVNRKRQCCGDRVARSQNFLQEPQFIISSGSV
jgi:hypothetical protein